MAKHKSWHGADIKRARKKKEQAEKRKKAQVLRHINAADKLADNVERKEDTNS